MIPKPKVISIPSPNFDAGRSGQRPVAVVLHIMSGTIAAASSWFLSQRSQVSAHFGIGKDGMIQQYVNEDDTAWGNGLRWEGGKWYTVSGSQVNPPAAVVQNRPGVNPNLYTISIEHEGKPFDTWTPAMLQQDISLIAYLCERYGITPDRDHIIGHCEIDPITRPHCPGDSCPFDAIIRGVQKVIQASKVQVDVDWHNEYMAVLGVSQHHEGTLKFIARQLAGRGSDDADSKHQMDVCAKVAQAALAGQWLVDDQGVPLDSKRDMFT